MLDRERRKESILASLKAMGGPVGGLRTGRKKQVLGRPQVSHAAPPGRPLAGFMGAIGARGSPLRRVLWGRTKPRRLQPLPPVGRVDPSTPAVAPKQKSQGQGGTGPQPNDAALLEEGARSKTDLLLRFKKVARCVALLCRLYRDHHLLATHNYGMERVRRCGSEQQHNLESEEDILFDVTKFRIKKQARIADSTVRILSLHPGERQEPDLRRVLVALRPSKAFGTYSTKLQRKVVRVAWYSRYESRQVMVLQGQQPHTFYTCLSGSATVIKKHSESGQLKPAWFFSQGDTFGDREILSGDCWHFTVIIQEPAEFLCIDREDFLRIFCFSGRNVIGDPEQMLFLRSLRFLSGWPVHLLEEDPTKCTVCHFRRGAVILRNSNVTEWIYIVKSGSCSLFKVFKEAPPINNLAPVRRPKQTSITEAAASLVKPEIRKPIVEHRKLILDKCLFYSQASAGITLGDRVREKENSPREAHALVPKQRSRQRDFIAHQDRASRDRTRSPRTQRDAMGSEGGQRDTPDGLEIPVLKMSNERSAINREPAPMKSAHLRPSMLASVPEGDKTQKVQKPVPARRRGAPVLITLGTLARGAVFGLSDVLFRDQSSLSVVSNGVECLKISKRFYLDHVPEEVIERLRQHEQPYPTEKDLWEQLQRELQWQAFRKITLKSTLQHFEQKRRLLQHTYGNKVFQPHWKG